MASAYIRDICTCEICLETFDEISKRPRMLSCGHSFCHSCLGRILALNPCCPTCRAEILFQSPESIPINYSLKRLIDVRSQILLRNTSTNLPQTREALGTLCQNRSVYAVEDRYHGTRYGKVALKDGRILLASFLQKKPIDAALFALPELLSRFNNGSSELPKTVFLRVAPDDESEDSFDVIIETDGLTRRAKNCILLCSALKGPFYKGLPMNYISFLSCYYIPSFSPPVVEGIRDDDPGTPLKEGRVYVMGEPYSQFQIQLKDQPFKPSFPKFGVVVAGLQEMKDLGERDCSIEECGLVI